MPESLFERGRCSALVITCSDFRFKSAERGLAASLGLTDDYDLIARPGAARALVAPKSAAAAETLREEIALLHRLHGFRRVLLVHHESCRAYDDIATAADERAVHEKHLRRAADVVRELVSGVSVERYLAQPEGSAIIARRVG